MLKQWRELKARLARSIEYLRDRYEEELGRDREELERDQEELYERLRRENSHAGNLEIFMARLNPRDENSNPMEHYSAMSHNPAVLQICDTWDRNLQCIRLADGPLKLDDEDIAKCIVSILTRQRVDRHMNDFVRTLGRHLCAKGGRWLMMLVACRAQYLSDPAWRVKRGAYITVFRESAGEKVGVVVAAGPLIRELEYAWDGICGWKR